VTSWFPRVYHRIPALTESFGRRYSHFPPHFHSVVKAKLESTPLNPWSTQKGYPTTSYARYTYPNHRSTANFRRLQAPFNGCIPAMAYPQQSSTCTRACQNRRKMAQDPLEERPHFICFPSSTSISRVHKPSSVQRAHPDIPHCRG